MGVRKTSNFRPIMGIIVATMLVVALACGGEAATPTSPPTATQPAPTATAVAEVVGTATAVPEATATAVPETDRDFLSSAAALLKSPGYDPAWGTPKYGGKMTMRTNLLTVAGAAFGHSGNSHRDLLTMALYSTLVGVDAWTGWPGGVQPDLAKSWEVSQDGLTYIFHLRQGVHFRSATEYDVIKDLPGLGKELTCEDVQATMEFKGTKRWFAEGGTGSFMIDSALHTWTCPDGPDGYTVKVTLDSGIPSSGLLMMLAVPGANGMLNKEWMEYILENYPIKWIQTGEITAHMGTGAWLPVSNTPQVVSKAVANPNYWKPGLPFLDRFEFHSIPDPATAFAAWATGKIDIMGHGSGSMYPAQVKQALRTLPDKPIVANHYFGARSAGFNTLRPPFDDVRVRKAVHLVQDRQQWLRLESIGDGRYASITGGFFNALGKPYNPMGHSIEEILTWPGFRQPKDQDIAEAKRLMDEVYGVGVRPGPFECFTRNDDTSINNCLYTGEMVSKYLGLTLTVKTWDLAALTSQLTSCTWTFTPTVIPGWDATPDPYLRYVSFNTKIPGFRDCIGGVNEFDRNIQSRLNNLIEDLRRELDFDKRAKISKEIEYLIYNEYILNAPIGWQNLFTGTQPWLRGWRVADHAIHTGHITQPERTWTVR